MEFPGASMRLQLHNLEANPNHCVYKSAYMEFPGASMRLQLHNLEANPNH